MKQYVKDAGPVGMFYLLIYGGSAVAFVVLLATEMIRYNFF